MDRRVWRSFLLFSLVSMFADMCYEAVRGVIGAYLEAVGAPGWVVGLLALAEGASYLGRLAAGFMVAAAPGLAWILVFLGYGAVYALPLLALAPPSLVLLLYLVERLGKGLRAPARDTLLSLLTERIGHGRGFGLHEVFDQVGAVAGPVILGVVAGVAGLRAGILFAAIPATIAVACLAAARASYPFSIVEAAGRRVYIMRGGEGRLIALFAAYAFTVSAILAYWPAVAYTLAGMGVRVEEVSFTYAAAMLVDAAAAMAVGELYDRVGVWAAAAAPVLAASSLLVLRVAPVPGVLLWGLGMGSVEVFFRALPASILGPRGRARAYGVLGASVAAGWLLVSIVIEAGLPLHLLLAYTVAMLAASLASLGLLARCRAEG